MYDWNDLRHFLAVARTGNLLAAGKVVGVNPTTTARRIAVLEAALEVRLFDRLQNGYRLTEAGEEFLAQAERVEQEAESLAHLAQRRNRALAGVLRVTTNEAFANMVLTPCLAEFADLYPGIRVEVVVSDQWLDVARGEADIALRAGAPDHGGVVGRKLCDLRWSIYASRTYADRRGFPADEAALDSHLVIGGDGALAELPSSRWLQDRTPRAERLSKSNSLGNLLAATKAGLGIAPLPCMMGDAEADLIRCLPPIPELDAELWLITREQIRELAHVRTFNTFIAGRIASIRHLLAAKETGK